MTGMVQMRLQNCHGQGISCWLKHSFHSRWIGLYYGLDEGWATVFFWMDTDELPVS